MRSPFHPTPAAGFYPNVAPAVPFYPNVAKAVEEQPDAFSLHMKRGKKSAMLLLTGAVSGFWGFVCVAIIGQYNFSFGPPTVNFRGEPMQSGQNYYPVSISEMVHDASSPQGKCFFAFSIVAAMCILVSFHSYHLRNCYVGDDLVICRMSYLGLRAVLPPVGLVLCSAVTMTPVKQATPVEWVANAMHCVGAGLFLSGYIIFELQCLCFSKVVKLDEEGGEKVARLTCVALTVLTMAIWITSTQVAMGGDKLGLCCSPVWQVPTKEDIALAEQNGKPATAMATKWGFEHNEKMLLNTANETVLAFTFVAYWGEALAGIFMLCGLLVIWWYCPERQLDLDEEFEDYSDNGSHASFT